MAARSAMIDGSEFEGKVAVVTGAGQGMGKAVSQRLSSGGAKLVINDVSAESAERTVASLVNAGGEAVAAPGDVTSKADVDRMVRTALDRYGGVHILVNNAGVLRPTHVIDIEEDEWDLVVGVNLKGTYLCSRAVLLAMREQGWGRIVSFSSTAGRKYSTIGGAHYSAAKAGILGFTRHLAKEEAGNGITVNAVCPGLIDTEMVRDTIESAKIKEYVDSFPIPRIGESWEVAELVAFIASDRAAYMTGVSFDINGGDLMM
jgi:NAD(P)-dependent dehydrogenase (short-subunit alcohol dehydrogenase family)